MEPALKHRTSDPGHRPLQTEAHVHAHGAQPSCTSTARVWSPASATPFHREQTMTYTVEEGAFHSSPRQPRWPARVAGSTQEAKENKKWLPEQCVCVKLSRTEYSANKGRNTLLVALLQGLRPVVSTSQTLPRELDPGWAPPSLLEVGSDSRHHLQEEGTLAPQLNPNNTWRSQVNLQLRALSTNTIPLSEERMSSHPVLNTNLQRKCRLSSEKLCSSFKVTELLSHILSLGSSCFISRNEKHSSWL